MKILLQLSLLGVLCLIGNCISYFLNFKFPGAIIAMVLLLILLLTGIVKSSSIKESTTWFQNNMAFFFLPPCLAIIDYIDLLKKIAVPLIAVCVLSTIVTFFAASTAARIAIFVQNKIMNKRNKNDNK